MIERGAGNIYSTYRHLTNSWFFFLTRYLMILYQLLLLYHAEGQP